jgi:hypothetical protein
MPPLRLEPAKEEARRSLPPGHPGREAVLCAPDEVSEEEFAILLPTWIKLLRLKANEVR